MLSFFKGFFQGPPPTKITESSKLNSFKTIEQNQSYYKFFICPICKERISIQLNPKKYNLSYICSNNHSETDLSYSDFLNPKYILTKKIINCEECGKKILDINNILCCKDCKKEICENPNCILLHKNNNAHCNYIYPNDLLNKCKKHNLDISHYCKNCNKNLCVFCFKEKDNEKDHQDHCIINIKDLLPKDEDIEKNKKLLNEKLNMNDEIITKMIKWKNEIISKVENAIELIESDSKINKLIINNFYWKYLNYNYYNSYVNTSKNITKYNNKFIEKLIQSKNFKDDSIAMINLLNNLYEKNDEQNTNKEEELLEILNKGKKIYLDKNISFIVEDEFKTKFVFDNKINLEDSIYNNLINLKETLFNKIPDVNILIFKKNSNLFEISYNKKNKIDNNFNIFFEAKKNENKKNKSNSVNGLYSNSIFTTNQNKNLFGSNNIFSNLNKNNINNNSTYYNSKSDNILLYSNTVNEEKEEESEENEEEEEYVYVSRTGCKYHGYSNCGRMMFSTKMTLEEAERMGLEPCMKCYY